uniref:Uncharacterized protein n=1 Tax=Leersia perrieri TaxID=77586 RepID=A0A0D9VG47_9ORYZ
MASPFAYAGGMVQHMLFEAADSGDLYIVKGMAMLLDEGRGRPGKAVQAARLGGIDEAVDGMGVQHIAASKGRLGVCRYLIEELRMDVDDVDEGGKTPLMMAILLKHVSTVKYLPDHGADVNKASHDGSTPLHLATRLGDCGMVQLLLAKGACVDPVAYCGTPLHVAATQGQDGVMKILLDHSADFNKMVDGRTPLAAAMSAGELKCVNLLIEAGGVVSRDHTSTAAKGGSTERFNYSMEETGANSNISDNGKPVSKRKATELKSLGNKAVEKKDYLSTTGFYMDLCPDDATLFSNRSLCWHHMGDGGKALLDAYECRKLRPDWPKAYYRQGSALMLLKDYESACEALYDGFKLDPGNSEIQDALREAMESWKESASTEVNKGRLEVCRYLIEELRLDVDDVDQEGRTLLIIAILFNHVSTVEYLLNHGADVNKARNDGFTPLHLAYCGTPLHVAASEGRDGAMKILLHHSAGVGGVVSGDCTLTAEESGLTEHFNYSMEETGANCNIFDDGEPVSKMNKAELKSLGNEAVEKKDYLSATRFYSKAVELYPDDATLFSNRSLCWHHMGDGGKALLDVYECRKLRPDWPKAYYRQGAALILLKDYESACEALYDGFKLDPGNSEIENALREALESLKASAITEVC